MAAFLRMFHGCLADPGRPAADHAVPRLAKPACLFSERWLGHCEPGATFGACVCVASLVARAFAVVHRCARLCGAVQWTEPVGQPRYRAPARHSVPAVATATAGPTANHPARTALGREVQARAGRIDQWRVASARRTRFFCPA